MIEFLQSYGLWIALAGVFVAMHWFGKGYCGGGHQHGDSRDTERQTPPGLTNSKPMESGTKTAGGCH